MRLALITLAIAGLLLAGCAQPAQQTVEQATGGQAKQKSDQATSVPTQAKDEVVVVKGPQGEQITAGSQLPDELKNLPSPQGFTSEGGGTITKGGDKLSVASWKGKGTVQATADYYKSTLPKQGWKEESTFAAEDSALLNYTKDDQNTITVAIGKEGDQVSVSVMLGKTAQAKTPTAGAGTSGDTAKAASTAAAQAKAAASPTAEKPETAATPAAPQTTDAGSVPPELKDLPMPAGFAPVKGSAVRVAQGGVFAMAEMKWFGKATVKEAAAALQRSLPGKAWKEDMVQEGEDATTLVYEKEDGARLAISISTVEAGTEIQVLLTK